MKYFYFSNSIPHTPNSSHLSLFVKLSIPFSKIPQTNSQTCRWFIPKVTFQSTRICISHRHITRLHRNQFLVSFKVVIFRQYFRPYQFLTQNLYKVQQILWILIANVVHCIWWNRKTVLSVFLSGAFFITRTTPSTISST